MPQAQPDLTKKKRLVVLVYFTVFFTLFALAVRSGWQRRIDDARDEKAAYDAAAAASASKTAPVSSKS